MTVRPGVTTISMRASCASLGTALSSAKSWHTPTRTARVLFKVSIVIAAALPDAMAADVKRRSRHENQVHVVRLDGGQVSSAPKCRKRPLQGGQARPPDSRASRPRLRIGAEPASCPPPVRRAAPRPEPIHPERPAISHHRPRADTRFKRQNRAQRRPVPRPRAGPPRSAPAAPAASGAQFTFLFMR